MSVAPMVGKAVVAVRRLTRWLLLFGVPLVAVVGGLYIYAHGGRYEETENAYVKADIIAVSAEVTGRVIEVAVRDNEPVGQGALLFRLDRTPFEIEQARARGQIKQMERSLGVNQVNESRTSTGLFFYPPRHRRTASRRGNHQVWPRRLERAGSTPVYR